MEPPRCFISYAREDLDRVRPIVKLIEDNGWSVFWDRTIPAGLTWRGYIGKALDEAKCVIVVWSRNSINSEFVQEEADDGRERRILIPIRIDDVRPPLGFRAIQHEDLTSWKGEPNHRRAKSLINAIERIAGKSKKRSTMPSAKPKAQVERDWARPKETSPTHKTPATSLETPLQQRITNIIGMEFVLIPAGSFKMGGDRCNNEKPIHQVTISKPFYLQTTQVTQAHWKAVMRKHSIKKIMGDKWPVESVSWDDVQKFIKKLNKMEKVKQHRLPTEAEWEYACRAGTTT